MWWRDFTASCSEKKMECVGENVFLLFFYKTSDIDKWEKEIHLAIYLESNTMYIHLFFIAYYHIKIYRSKWFLQGEILFSFLTIFW